jgi:purine-binding chemotaxis protein CheW
MPEAQRTARNVARKQSRPAAQYLLFHVSKVELAVSLNRVSEIVPYERVTGLPGTPAFARGVIHVRGRMVPVMDTAVRLGLHAEPPGKRSCIVILDVQSSATARTIYGLAVDRVSSLLDVDVERVRAAPDFGVGVDVRYLEGLYYVDDRVLPLISAAAMFSEHDLRSVLPPEAP